MTRVADLLDRALVDVRERQGLGVEHEHRVARGVECFAHLPLTRLGGDSVGDVAHDGHDHGGGNVVHLVLARLPDAPKGVKGISLFLCPKFLPGADGGLGARNAISVGALEHKMGIHAQPTCVMNYDGATGWLVGEPGRGLAAMFTMMNAERLMVGVQGLGVAEVANVDVKTETEE